MSLCVETRSLLFLLTCRLDSSFVRTVRGDLLGFAFLVIFYFHPFLGAFIWDYYFLGVLSKSFFFLSI